MLSLGLECLIGRDWPETSDTLFLERSKRMKNKVNLDIWSQTPNMLDFLELIYKHDRVLSSPRQQLSNQDSLKSRGQCMEALILHSYFGRVKYCFLVLGLPRITDNLCYCWEPEIRHLLANVSIWSFCSLGSRLYSQTLRGKNPSTQEVE